MPRPGGPQVTGAAAHRAPDDPSPTARVPPVRPLRRDAARNRQRILAAAQDLFAQRGLSASLNDIAHHAGVGVGTVYRHFPDKDQLVEGLFEQRIEALVTRMAQALADPDPWRGLTSFIRYSSDLQARDHALKDLLTGGHVGLARISELRARLAPMGEELVSRAHACGRLRPEIQASDLPMIQAVTSSLIDASAQLAPELYRRYLEIMIRGIAVAPEQEPPLSSPAPAPDAVEQIMVNVKQPRR